MSGFVVLHPNCMPIFLPNERMKVENVLTRFVHKERTNETVSDDTRLHYSTSEKNGPANTKASVLLGKPVYGTVILSKNGCKYTEQEARTKIDWLKTIHD